MNAERIASSAHDRARPDKRRLVAHTNAAVDTALRLAREHQLPVFPCGPDKRPLTKHGFKDATSDEKAIRQWWSQYPGALVGVPTGAVSGLLVIDIDPDGIDFMLQHDELDTGRRHDTRRGFHFLFRAPADVPIRGSAGKLAKGVDVRAEGGYIVWWPAIGLKVHGPGIDKIPAVPAQLLDLLIKSSPRAALRLSSPSSSSTASMGDLQRLEQALAKRNSDCGYDDWIQVGMALHHESGGSEEGFRIWNDWSANGETKYRGADDLRGHWDSFSSEPGKNVVTAGSILRDDVASPDEFENEEGDASSQRFAVLADHQFIARAPLTWHIKGVLPKAELIVLYGPSGSGKSFLAFDMVAAISTGASWQGHKATKGRVVYVVAEGAMGFLNRLKAFATTRGSFPGVRIVADAPNLLGDRDYGLLAQQIEASGGADLIVIDTLAASSPGADENAGKDMGRIIEHCKRLHNATGATVLLIHHSGKDESKGARGWSGLRAATDAEIEVSKSGDDRIATVTKMKDGEEGARFAFKLTSVEIGVDVDGEPVTSCVVEPVDVAPTGARKAPRPGTIERTLLDVVRDDPSVEGGAAISAIVEAAAKQLPEPEGRDTRKQHVMRALRALVSKGFIAIDGERCWVL